jgi:hypothetical protein
LLAVAFALGISGCGAPTKQPGQQGTAGHSPFREIAAETGLDFVHDSGMTGHWWMNEIMAPGGSVFDFDNDGDLDIYCVQGMPVGRNGPEAGVAAQGDRLLKNELIPSGRLRFTDVTATALTAGAHYGMGAAAADYDGDGWVDLYVTEFNGPNRLLRNNGDGTFTDVTARAGVSDGRWSTSASWADYDGDGRLDLFVANYVRLNQATHRVCRDFAGRPLHCPPSSYEGEPSRLFRNQGNGRFTDVSATSGIGAKAAPGLGVIAADFDGDGLTDFYVANDAKPNHLWRNGGAGRFEESGLTTASAVNEDGKAEASMGLLAGDFDGDGDWDLFATHLTGEKNTLYRNEGGGVFTDSSAAMGMDAPTRPFTGFGTAAVDVDNDGWQDVFVANGAISPLEEQRKVDAYPFRQVMLLFRNLAGTRFEEWTGLDRRMLIGRGVAAGDLDNDGFVDLVVFSCQGPVSLLRNEHGGGNGWLGLRLVTADGKRDALGAVAEAHVEGGRVIKRRSHTDGSYLSSNDPRVVFGLGAAGEVARVAVQWPDGSRETWSGPAANRYEVLRQGTGKREEPR